MKFDDILRGAFIRRHPARKGAPSYQVLLHFRSEKELALLVNDLDAGTILEAALEHFGLQKNLSEFLGVGESTVAGWFKNSVIPTPAAIALLAHWVSMQLAKVTDQSYNPFYYRIVEDGSSYALATIVGGDEQPYLRTIARGIPDKVEAQRLAAGPRYREILETLMCELNRELELSMEDNAMSRAVTRAENDLMKIDQPEVCRQKQLERDELAIQKHQTLQELASKTTIGSL